MNTIGAGAIAETKVGRPDGEVINTVRELENCSQVLEKKYLIFAEYLKPVLRNQPSEVEKSNEPDESSIPLVQEMDVVIRRINRMIGDIDRINGLLAL